MRPSEAALRLARDGYVVFPADPATRDWAYAARDEATRLVADPDLRAAWLRCAGTWFAGVDVLTNASDGSVGAVPLAGPALDMLGAFGLAPTRWHAGQVSIVYPGYPQPKEGESPGAGRYRVQRDAAHVDGLLPEGQGKRILREPHAFVLGLPLTDSAAEAAPLVVWPGSHRTMGPALARARADRREVSVSDLDLSKTYRDARRIVFDTCPRQPICARPGEAVLLHRHLLHGIGPWTAPPEPAGRAVAYFRPQLDDPEAWFARDAAWSAAEPAAP